MKKVESEQKNSLLYALRRSVRRDAAFRFPSYLERCEWISIEQRFLRRVRFSVMFCCTLSMDFKVNVLLRMFNHSSTISVGSATRGEFRSKVKSRNLPTPLYFHKLHERVPSNVLKQGIRTDFLTVMSASYFE